MAKARSWILTLNNPDFPPADLPAWDNIRFAKWQLEKGESGTEHIQGFVQLVKQSRLSALTKWLPRAHFEPKKFGQDEDMASYCCKEETRIDGPWERGSFHTQPGKRTELDAFKDAIDSGKPYEDIVLDHLEVVAKYPALYRTVKWAASQKTRKRVTLDSGKYSWQAQLDSELQLPPDDRKIVWIYDEVGGVGKTKFASYLQDSYEASYLRGGKRADVAQSLDSPRIVVFDFARDGMDNVDYVCIEQVKDGRVFSPKYESRMLTFDPPHVVVFSNKPPPQAKLSEDRWDLRRVVKHGSDYVFIGGQFKADSDSDTDLSVDPKIDQFRNNKRKFVVKKRSCPFSPRSHRPKSMVVNGRMIPDVPDYSKLLTASKEPREAFSADIDRARESAIAMKYC